MPSRRLQFLIAATFLTLSLSIAASDKHQHNEAVKKLPAGENLLWSDHGDVAAKNFVYGVGGESMAPKPPFRFVNEDFSGTNPKLTVKDANGVTWNAKFGSEAKPSVMATRIAWACGYYVETEYFVGHGQISGVHHLKRAAKVIQYDGSFGDSRFQLRSDNPEFLQDVNWTWASNPFVGTPQLNGLKVLVMLMSNWDTKDARDFDPGSGMATADTNLGIFKLPSLAKPAYEYFISDWGASFGKWGPLGARSKWNCRVYAEQTPEFVKGVEHGEVRFGYVGKHSKDITEGITTADVRWLMQYLGRITDAQLRQGLASSGATPEETDCYLRSIRDRVAQLNRAAAQ